MSSVFDLDSILDQALDEFEALSETKNLQSHSHNCATSSPHPKHSSPSRSYPLKTCDSSSAVDESSSIHNISISKSFQNDDSNLEALSIERDDKASNEDEINVIFKELSKHIVDGLKKESLSDNAKDAEDKCDNAKGQDDEQYDNLMESVMEQLLGKEVMAEPVLQICSRFPCWIEANRDKLSSEELENYERMFACFRKINSEYTTGDPNVKKIMDLIFEVQQYGQPPQDIINDMAPGFLFDPNVGISSAKSTNSQTSASTSFASESSSNTKVSKDLPNFLGDDIDLNDVNKITKEFKDEIEKKISAGDCPVS